MKNIWLTYSWEDNKDSSVEFIAQELNDKNINVHIDKWTFVAGNRLWEQIADNISNPSKCDAWILYATQNSLTSEPCKEEFAYALNRALKLRGSSFPIIGLFPSSIEDSIIPPAISARLYVSLNDSNWKERIKSSILGEVPSIQRTFIQPFYIKKQIINIGGNVKYLIEIRPRAGQWSPCFAGIPLNEKNILDPSIFVAPTGDYSFSGIHTGGECESADGKVWMMYSSTPASPTTNILLTTSNSFPSIITFGKYATRIEDIGPQFNIVIKNIV